MVISYSLGGFEVLLKVPVIIIMRFGENNVIETIYINFGGGGFGGPGGYIVHFTFFYYCS